MTRFLLDTSVLSLMAPGRAKVSSALANWFRAHSEQLFVSTITIAEVQQGICKLRRSGSEERGQLLEAWLYELIDAGANRIVSFDTEEAIAAGRISDAATAKGRHPGFADVAIAAIATTRDMTLLTTNGRHFEPLAVSWSDPSVTGFLETR